jgi:hypothetical protein
MPSRPSCSAPCRARACRRRRWPSSRCPSRWTAAPSACWPATASAAATASWPTTWRMLRILATLAGQLLQLERWWPPPRAACSERNAQLTRGAAQQRGALRHRRHLAAAAAGAGRAGARVGGQRQRAAAGRIGHRQGAVRPRAAPGQPAPRRAVHQGQLRGDPGIAVRERALRPRARRLHRRQGERAGWFELADGGTIFLDEIGELPLPLQTKLLRTLQEGTVLRLGGKREKKVDVRLVAATHRDLEQEVTLGQLPPRPVLPAHVIPIRLPALRERPRRHPAAGPALPEPRQPGAPAQRDPHARGAGAAGAPPLARQHPRAGQRDRARGAAGRRAAAALGLTLRQFSYRSTPP